MYIYSLYIGEYFLFLLTASNTNPIKLLFKDHETTIKGKKPNIPWKEKIYLYPAILQRKWIDYKIKDKFIPHVCYDNILPCELDYIFLNSICDPAEIRICTIDKQYKNIDLQIINKDMESVYNKKVDYLTTKREKVFPFSIKKPGVYRILISDDEEKYYKSTIIFYHKLNKSSQNDYNNFIKEMNEYNTQTSIYCSNCRSRVYPFDTEVIHRYIYKNYIPFKEYIDINGLGMDYISKYIMKIHHPTIYKRGLIHLLNIIRLASIEDEIAIVTSLFKDDPSFAYFITNRLFLFGMVPLMENCELQKILNTIDDTVIARSLINESPVLVKKVLKNISRRRAKIIQSEMNIYNRSKKSLEAKEETHKIIKSFFEEHYGRILRIPFSKKSVYSIKKSVNNQDDNFLKTIQHHSGVYIVIHDDQVFQCYRESDNDGCVQFDYEFYKDVVFTIAGVSEGTIYLKSEMGIRYSLIHTYYWITNLESSEFIENISKQMIVPLNYTSSGLILTIGALSSRGIPHEQVIRLKIK